MNTTIQISKETKELIASFGSKEETYEDIIKRLYDMAVKTQLREFLFATKDALTVDEARKLINNGAR